MKRVHALHALAASLQRRGLDIGQAFQVQLYNKTVPLEYQLPTFDRKSTLAYLIGNGRSAWDPFLRAVGDNARPMRCDPWDSWVVDVVEETCRETLPSEVKYEIRYGHKATNGQRVAMQRLAHCVGLAYYEPSCGLNVHPVLGPWVTFRAVVVLDQDGNQVDPCTPIDTSPCEAAGCREAQQQLLTKALGARAGTREDSWRRWLECRDACLVGRDHRYSDEQILFHYAQPPGLLHYLVRRNSTVTAGPAAAAAAAGEAAVPATGQQDPLLQTSPEVQEGTTSSTGSTVVLPVSAPAVPPSTVVA